MKKYLPYKVFGETFTIFKKTVNVKNLEILSAEAIGIFSDPYKYLQTHNPCTFLPLETAS